MRLKGLGRILFRCVIAAAGIGLLLLFLNASAIIALVVSSSSSEDKLGEGIVTITQGVKCEEDGTYTVSAEAQADLDNYYEWAMLLDERGAVVWEEKMPESLPRTYTVADAAAFSRWYLADYPVRCWRSGNGLMVLACAQDSEWKYDISMKISTIEKITAWIPLVICLNLSASLLLALGLGLMIYRSAAPVAQGIERLSQGKPIVLPKKGTLSTLCMALNHSSEQLESQRKALKKRDRTRTEWIAGVSHDIRTPLSIVQGNAASLEADSTLSAQARSRARLIRVQSQRIGRLVSDLNLASKLEYELQPLNITQFRPAVMLRCIAVDALNGADDDRISIEADISAAAEQLSVRADEALVRRAVENLLKNSIEHNLGPVHIKLSMDTEGIGFTICVSDDGTGLSTEQLSAIETAESEGIPTHGLGLVLVRQIVHAHGGSVKFVNTDNGLCVRLFFCL